MAEGAEVGWEATGVAMADICPGVVGVMEEGAVGEQRRLAVNCSFHMFVIKLIIDLHHKH
jgi:hypothetical protein